MALADKSRAFAVYTPFDVILMNQGRDVNFLDAKEVFYFFYYLFFLQLASKVQRNIMQEDAPT